jgi:hypothetical protein
MTGSEDSHVMRASMTSGAWHLGQDNVHACLSCMVWAFAKFGFYLLLVCLISSCRPLIVIRGAGVAAGGDKSEYSVSSLLNADDDRRAMGVLHVLEAGWIHACQAQINLDDFEASYAQRSAVLAPRLNNNLPSPAGKRRCSGTASVFGFKRRARTTG